MSTAQDRRPKFDPAFERKVRLSRAALLFERLWPRMWALIGLVGLFVLVSMLGVWSSIDAWMHAALLGAFGAAALAALVWAARTPAATRADAIRRIELRSGVPHRPASTYEDTSTIATDNPAATTLWQAHKARMAAMMARLKVGNPSPRADRFDPLALRMLLLMGVGLGVLMVGDSARDRIWAAFRFGAPVLSADARLDAWITPPAYTAKAPMILVDGSRAPGATPKPEGPLEVPTGSGLVIRAIGSKGLVVEFSPEGKPVQRLEAKAPEAVPTAAGVPPPTDIAEIKMELKDSGKIRVVGASGVEPWAIRIIPDSVPKIALTKDPEQMPRGAMKLTYKVEDDYGVVSAEARITRIRPKAGDPALSWARRAANKGARPPLEKPPVMALRLPRANSKTAEGSSYHELAGHPWAGMRVRLTLAAKDAANQTGRSEPFEFVLPQRRFNNPIAKAVVEQRRLLIEDPRNRAHVLKGLEAITMEPEGFFNDRRAYLGLRSAYHRLERDKTRAGMKTTVDQLWHVATRLEDGNLSDAERALREAQEKLTQALKDGATDEEIRQLMDELRQALNNFLEQMQRQAENGQQQQQGDNQNNRTIRQQDLERMMRDIENMARQGSRETAQDMLSQLRDLLEQLQNGRMAQGQQGQGQNNQMMQMMDQFGDIIGKQQQLLDDTFNEQRGDGQQQQGQGQQQGQQGQGQQPGQRGQGQQGQGQQPGQRGQGQQGQGQQPGQRGQGQQQGPGQPGQGQQQGQGQQPGGRDGQGLGERQGSLRERLGQLREGLRRGGMQAPDQLGNAEESMRQAEEALRRGDLEGAARAEQEALNQLRQGAQQMVQQMLRNMPNQYGRAGDAPRDPLGRPPRTDGPDLGTSVKVPDEIDVQRAREILEELRKRMGEPTRPLPELDYIERLLRRF